MMLVLLRTVMVSISLVYNGANALSWRNYDNPFSKMNSFHNQRSSNQHFFTESLPSEPDFLQNLIKYFPPEHNLKGPIIPSEPNSSSINPIIPRWNISHTSSRKRKPISPSYPSNSISPSYPSNSNRPSYPSNTISPSYPSYSDEPISPDLNSLKNAIGRLSQQHKLNRPNSYTDPSYPSNSNRPSYSDEPISPDLNSLKNAIGRLSQQHKLNRPNSPSSSTDPINSKGSISPSPSRKREPISPSEPNSTSSSTDPSYPSNSNRPSYSDEPISPDLNSLKNAIGRLSQQHKLNRPNSPSSSTDPINSKGSISPSPSRKREPISPSEPNSISSSTDPINSKGSISHSPISPKEPNSPNNSSDLGNLSDRSQGTNTSSSSPPCDCGKKKQVLQSRIIGGKITDKNEYIWVVLVKSSLGRCVGTIITVKHVNTAGHCTEGVMADQIRIYTGRHNSRYIDEKVGIYNVSEKIEHDHYGNNTSYYAIYDIAILVTETIIIFGPLVGPICLPKKEFDLKGHQLNAMGWGITNDIDDDGSLREVDITSITLDACRKHLSKALTEENTQICTIGYKKNVCNGDSGSGLVYYDSDNDRYVQLGILSYHPSDNCVDGKPTVFTAVYPFMDWIRFQVSKIKPEVTVYEVDY